MSDNIFDGQTPAEPIPSSTPVSVVPTELTDFVGDGKKYKSVEDALKSIPHAQAHIAKLEEETRAIREELQKRATTEELLEQMRSESFVKESNQPVTPAIDPSVIEQIVNNTLQQRSVEAIKKENITKVVSSFTSHFGDVRKGEEAYNKLAQENGLDVGYLNNLAATAPDMVLKLAGLVGKSQPQPVGKTTSTVNTESFNSQTVPPELSSKVPVVGSSTKDLARAIANARAVVMQKYNS